MVLRSFALRSLKEFKLMIVRSFLSFGSASFRRQIALLQSSFNLDVLCLLEGELFGYDFFC